MCLFSPASVLIYFQNASGDPAVSSTVNPLTTKRSKVKTEAEGPLPISPISQVSTFSISVVTLEQMSVQYIVIIF